jgi:hypothetical protein
MKANREKDFPDIRRIKREIWIEPTIEDCYTFYERYIIGCEKLSIDIETAGNQITCIGFAPSGQVALVVPFFDRRKKGSNYWPTQKDEAAAWDFVRMVCSSNIPKLGQNILYDIAFTWRAVGIEMQNVEHDSMLCHHALQPESLKGLGFLASIYLSEGAWKQMRTETVKRDE